MTRRNVLPVLRRSEYKLKNYMQESFRTGMYNDPPTTEVPSTSVHYLYNTLSRGGYLETRSGTREWGNYETNVPALPLPDFVENVQASTWMDSPDDLERVWDFSIEIEGLVVGDYITYEQPGTFTRVSEKITWIDPNDVTIVHTESRWCIAGVFNLFVSVGAPLDGMYYEKKHDKVVVCTGHKFFVSNNYTMTEWREAILLGLTDDPDVMAGLTPARGTTTFVSKDGVVYAFNANGLYRVDVGKEFPTALKTNTGVPVERLEDKNVDEINPEKPYNDTYKFGRKRVYTYCRLADTMVPRNKSKKQPEWESGGVQIDEDNKRDFGAVWSVDPCSPDNPHVVSMLVPPTDEQHLTHYRVYSTLNIDKETGIKYEGNNPEELIWEIDVPVVNSFKGLSEGPVVAPQVYRINAGVVDHEFISEKGPAIVVEATTSGVLNKYEGNFEFGYGTEYLDIILPGATLTDGEEYIVLAGAKEAGRVTYENGVITFDSSTVDDASLLLVPGTMVYSNTAVFTVIEKTGAYKFKVSSGVNTSDGEYIVGWGELTERSIYSTVTDTDLLARIESWPMVMRFWEPLQSGELGTINGAFCFVGAIGDGRVEYSQMTKGFEYLMGQHNPIFQYTELDDALSEITSMASSVILKCKTSTVYLTTSKYTTGGYPNVGRSVFIIQYEYTASDSIGTNGVGCSVRVPGENKEMVLTNEPALRLFDGKNYGDNLLEQKLMTKLQELKGEYACTYTKDLGFVFWGRV